MNHRTIEALRALAERPEQKLSSVAVELIGAADADTRFACYYLIANGYTFGGEFGLLNAKQIATNVAQNREAGRPRLRYPHDPRECDQRQPWKRS